MNLYEYARTVMKRCDQLAQLSEEPGRLTRRVATPALKQAIDVVASWMTTAGMQVRQDAIGNLIGRFPSSQAEAKTFVLGSHLDSVRDAGKYDGPLGVLTALACVEMLHDHDRQPLFNIEVVGFADEEGLRYRTSYLGSQVYAGTFDPADLARIDDDGIRMEDAIVNFGGNPSAINTVSLPRSEMLGYCELHIEQGPVLESLDLPVGVVTAIAGATRFTLTFIGMAGHAGTVPMNLRQDALAAAAEFVLAVESIGQSTPGLVATVGKIQAEPGAGNVIPGKVLLSLDIRHQDDVVRQQAIRLLSERSEGIVQRRKVQIGWDVNAESPAVPLDGRLIGKLAKSIEAAGYPVHKLPSGAGHDSVTLSQLMPCAMLFVRCKGGISHNPAEAVTVDDVAVGIDVLSRFLGQL